MSGLVAAGIFVAYTTLASAQATTSESTSTTATTTATSTSATSTNPVATSTAATTTPVMGTSTQATSTPSTAGVFCVFPQNLTIGFSSPGITCLQNYLIMHNYLVMYPADGVFGSSTKAAFTMFQTDLGITIAGQLTLPALPIIPVYPPFPFPVGSTTTPPTATSTGTSTGTTSPTTGTSTTATSTSLNAQCAIDTTLEYDVRGNDVSCLQNFLIANHYLDIEKSNGYFGPLTRMALMQLQADLHVDPTGTFVPSLAYDATTAPVLITSLFQGKTLDSNLCLVGRSIKLGASGNDVTCLQNYLIANHYLDFVRPDGYYEEPTRDAVMKFQKANSMTESGEIALAFWLGSTTPITSTTTPVTGTSTATTSPSTGTSPEATSTVATSTTATSSPITATSTSGTSTEATSTMATSTTTTSTNPTATSTETGVGTSTVATSTAATSTGVTASTTTATTTATTTTGTSTLAGTGSGTSSTTTVATSSSP